MATEAALRGDGCRFVVRIECYSSPQLSAGTDANFLTGEVELNVGSRASFQVRSRVVLRVEELMDFRDQLKALDRDLDGEVTQQSRLRLSSTRSAGRWQGNARRHRP